MSNSILNLRWRYATKLFDTQNKISQSDFEQLLQSIQLTASSFGMQPYKILIINDAFIRAQLKPFSWNQSQITDASHLLLFCSKLHVTQQDIDVHIQNIAVTRAQSIEDLQIYKNRLQNFLNTKSEKDIQEWATRQLYIVLGNILTVCAQKGIDSCPIEGFESEKYDEVLKLAEMGLKSVFVLPLGYRDANDKYQHLAKVRKSFDDLFINI